MLCIGCSTQTTLIPYLCCKCLFKTAGLCICPSWLFHQYTSVALIEFLNSTNCIARYCSTVENSNDVFAGQGDECSVMCHYISTFCNQPCVTNSLLHLQIEKYLADISHENNNSSENSIAVGDMISRLDMLQTTVS